MISRRLEKDVCCARQRGSLSVFEGVSQVPLVTIQPPPLWIQYGSSQHALEDDGGSSTTVLNGHVFVVIAVSEIESKRSCTAIVRIVQFVYLGRVVCPRCIM